MQQLEKMGFAKLNFLIPLFFLLLITVVIGTMAMSGNPPLFQKNHIQAAHTNFTYTESDGIVHIAAQTQSFYGASMFPSLTEGNTVLIQEYAGQKIRPGMIVVYIRGNLTIAHRVIATQNDGGVLVQGDNANSEELISEHDLRYILIGVLYT